MSDQTPQNYAHEWERLWNEEAGRTWVANIDQIDALIAPLSAISLEQAMPQEGEVVLDVGCGGGATSRHMAERVGSQGHVVGMDISAPLLSVAKERAGHLSNLRFELDDAQTMDLGADVFNLVYSRFGVMFFQDVIAAFANLHRALKPSGWLIFLCWRAGAENPWMRQPASAIQAIFPPPPNSTPDVPDPDAPGPFSLAQSERLYHVLQSSGFTDVKVEALDDYVSMGSVDEAMSFILGMMGPSEEQMSLAMYEQVTALHAAIGKIVAQYETLDGVQIPCAAWIVSARA